MKKLRADHVLNYKTDPTWGETARKLTPGGEGVDHVIEVGGAATLGQSLKATKHRTVSRGGPIALRCELVYKHKFYML